jgi:hypothetical protein
MTECANLSILAFSHESVKASIDTNEKLTSGSDTANAMVSATTKKREKSCRIHC